ncbi:MAG TPA: glycoside hydrolase family 2 TIM barrel-domain containing protein [Thermoleophilaceae bacterium]|nr:glycoside hydrolase family 2 TIM barrel-domain containing protein [Thermoleophilaceae bacterium]
MRLVTALTLLAAAAPAAAAQVPPERPLYADGPDGRHLLASGWETRADTRDRGLRERWYRPGRDRGFRSVRVPHAFNAGDRSSRGFRSRVQWYRARFDLPRDPDAVAWRLRFESVNREATVWLNGRRLGRHEGAHLPFELSARSLRPRDNELVVRVDGRESRTDLPPSTRPRGWWNWGGILREVYLRRVAALDLSDLQVTARRGDPARISWSARVRNWSGSPVAATVEARLIDPAGRETLLPQVSAGTLGSGRSGALAGEATVASPREWSPDDPALYTLELRLAGGQTVTTRFGIREWGLDGSGRATLNGRPLSLRGASFHEETNARGGALGPRERGQIVDELVALGADLARAHYPPHPALLEEFDRRGIVFWEQIPVWRLRDPHFRPVRLRREALSRLREAIERDRNHASIMTWSLANETLRAGFWERRYIRAARAVAKMLDPSRLVAADVSLRPLDQVPAHYSELDAIGLNEYLGWYGGHSSELPGDLAEIRRRFPQTALFVTEFGAEANRTGPASRKGTFAFQRDFLAEHLRLIDSAPEVSGAAVWALRDFMVRPGWRGGNPRPNPPWNHKGVFDRFGRPKASFDAVREAFTQAPAFR